MLPPEPAKVELNLWIEGQAPWPRRREPITIGIPWPRGLLKDEASLLLLDPAGQPVPLQVGTLEKWPDGSRRWTLLDWQASIAAAGAYRLRVAEPARLPADALQLSQQESSISIDTGAARFEVKPGSFPFARASVAGREVAAKFGLRAAGKDQPVHIERARLEESGPLRAAVSLEGTVGSTTPLLNLRARLEFFAGSATVRVALTLHNPRRAQHPGGIWQLGDPGSVFIESAAFTVGLPGVTGPAHYRLSPEPDAPWLATSGPIGLLQASSGGANWRSPNHRDRSGQVPLPFRGYRLQIEGETKEGLRATPILACAQEGQQVALAMPYFWQNFPKALSANDGQVTLALFPFQEGSPHELQGGEQKTHVCYAAFGKDEVTDEPLDWCRAPLFARAQPDWYCGSGAVACLLPR
ncbi:MAG: hypothetical protein AB7K24_28635, partial [Gemmataceae bacterium]